VEIVHWLKPLMATAFDKIAAKNHVRNWRALCMYKRCSNLPCNQWGGAKVVDITTARKPESAPASEVKRRTPKMF
jgi:hypothetical protein